MVSESEHSIHELKRGRDRLGMDSARTFSSAGKRGFLAVEALGEGIGRFGIQMEGAVARLVLADCGEFDC